MARKIKAKHINVVNDRRTQDLRVLELRDPAKIYKFSVDQIHAHGYDFDIKQHREGVLEDFSKFTTVGVCRVWQSSRFKEYPAWAQAAVMAHELVHILQIKTYGKALFYSRYLMDPRWRWAYELAASLFEAKVMINMGFSAERVLLDIRDLAVDIFPNKYYMRKLDQQNMRDHTLSLGRSTINAYLKEQGSFYV